MNFYEVLINVFFGDTDGENHNQSNAFKVHDSNRKTNSDHWYVKREIT